jgi:SAM-dependent methyltransferase
MSDHFEHPCRGTSPTEPAAREPYLGAVSEDTWADLADQFADGAYASVKGRVRTYVMHRQLLDHLPPPPGPVLDVGGGAGHQSFPLARAGYDVTLLDPSEAMLDKARRRLPDDLRSRVTFVHADGETPRKRCRAVASPPCCATVCSATSNGRSRCSTSCAGAPLPAAWSRS